MIFSSKVLSVIRNETEILNLKTRKTQIPLGYLTLKTMMFGLAAKQLACWHEIVS
jgi:hypothetical protein